MKRLICLVLAVVCLMPAAGAEEENWYLKTAEEMAACVGLLAGDEGYRSVLTSAELEGAQALAQAAYEPVISAYSCRMPDSETCRQLLAESMKITVSDFAWEYLYARLASSAVSSYVATKGSRMLALSTTLTYSKTFEVPEEFRNCVILLEVGGAVVGVSFARTGENTITVSAQPVLLDEAETAQEAAQGISSGSIPMEMERMK